MEISVQIRLKILNAQTGHAVGVIVETDVQTARDWTLKNWAAFLGKPSDRAEKAVSKSAKKAEKR